MIWIWLAATIAHVALSWRAAFRLLPAAASLDERIFTAVLVAIGGLSVVLHGVALITGLTLPAVLAALAVLLPPLFPAAESLIVASHRFVVPRGHRIAIDGNDRLA